MYKRCEKCYENDKTPSNTDCDKCQIEENICHHKALEEIEDNINKYFEESFYKNCRYTKGCTNACGLVTNGVLNKILDIINKAKGLQ